MPENHALRHQDLDPQDELLSQAAADGRVADRLALRLPLGYKMLGEYPQWQGRTTTTNVSGSGIQFIVPWDIPVETCCEITLSLPTLDAPLAFSGRVIWSRPLHQPAPESEIGVELVRLSGSEELFTRYCHFIASELLARYLQRPQEV